MSTRIIGLTGPFGSGCSSAAKYLRDERKFRIIRLSNPIRKHWGQSNAGQEPSRSDLQRLGGVLRRENGTSFLAKTTIDEIELGDDALLVVDAIRNLGEVDYLSARFGHQFILVAILAGPEERWNRIGIAYTDNGLGQADFLEDDQRDTNEETRYGQQVELCVDASDVLIDNSDKVSLNIFKKKIMEYVDLVTDPQSRPANRDETFMNVAYASRHSSKCLKRRVGAVVVKNEQIVGVGFNENPIGTSPCVQEKQYEYLCYRDILRNERFADLAARGIHCPRCAKKLSRIEGPPWMCDSCQADGVKTNLEAFFFPDRAMNWCTAVHAEVWAVLVAGDRCRDATLYTTTFPCFQCAEKITQMGIREVCFTEPYPDTKSRGRLVRAGIKLRQFEGVRSPSFERIFGTKKEAV